MKFLYDVRRSLLAKNAYPCDIFDSGKFEESASVLLKIETEFSSQYRIYLDILDIFLYFLSFTKNEIG